MELYGPGSSVPEPDFEEDLFDSVELYVPGPSVPEPYPEWDLATPEDLGAESKVLSELSSLENYVPLNVFQLEDRLKQCTLLKQRHVTNVWPRVFIGDEETATDRDVLQEMCITHILNAAAPKKDLNYFLGTSYVEDIVETVNTGSRYYRGLHINYYSLPTTDRHCSDISKYFMPAAKLIDKALDKRASKGKVLICCKQGVDHSATLFLAFLMIYHDMMVEDAIDQVIKSRRIRPSRDFLKKLMLLNADLVNRRKLKLQDIKTGRNRKKWQLKKK
uniref:Protein-serine/threonine phosphatase n=1 Tax=Sinocyclocheilus rhinocerous TaxID=307959 RepID=A0A673I569_9TELE